MNGRVLYLGAVTLIIKTKMPVEIPFQCHIVHPNSLMPLSGTTPKQLRNLLINCMSKNPYLVTGVMLHLSLCRWSVEFKCFVFGSLRFLLYGREYLHVFTHKVWSYSAVRITWIAPPFFEPYKIDAFLHEDIWSFLCCCSPEDPTWCSCPRRYGHITVVLVVLIRSSFM